MIETFAKWFAFLAHGYIGQKRKYTGQRYTTHTEAVRNIVKKYGGTVYQGAAAYLHDYREDVVTHLRANKQWFALWFFEFLYGFFPAQVRIYVAELTDIYTSEDFPVKENPLWNRKWRKAQEAARVSQISNEGKTIKLADLYHNTSSIVDEDVDFAITYLKEKHHMLKGLVGGNPELYAVVEKQMYKSIDLLGVIV